MSSTDPVVRPAGANLVATQIVPAPVAAEAEAPAAAAAEGDDRAASKASYVWASGENEFASRGRVSERSLNGVPRWSFGLESDTISVIGATSFRVGSTPTSAHGPSTANHDNFDQAVLYSGIREIAEQYEALTGKTFAALVRAKQTKTRARGVANSMTDVNAYYSRANEEVHFGTSSGKWDLAADKDVVKHEMGHHVLDHLAPNVRGPLHEGYGDAQATLSQGDPELSEDFGKIEGGHGVALRNANNNRTVANTSAAVHERGQVYAGFFWEIGEHLHTSLTGRPRDRTVDAQPLDRRAADHALRILWSFPLFLGTTEPEGGTVLRSVDRAIDSLAAAGRLRGVQIPQLKTFIREEALRRGLIDPPTPTPAPTSTDPGIPVALQSQERQAAIDEAISLAGFDPNTTSLEAVSTHDGPFGEKIERFRVRVALPMASAEAALVPVAGELLTLTTMPRGEFEAQVGRLPEVAWAIQGRRNRAIEPETLLESRVALAEQALADLRGLAGRTAPSEPRTAANDPHLARVALQQLTSDAAPAPQLVWRNGALALHLELDTLVFEGQLRPDGTLESMRRVSNVECGPEGFKASRN